MRWLRGRLPVPELIAIASQADLDYLLMTRLPGADGTDAHENLGGALFVQQFADALRMVHSVPPANCPFAASVTDLLAIAAERVRRGTVRREHFPARYLGQSPRELLDILHALRPQAEDIVLTHGDPSLPNFLFQDGEVSGIIDLGLVAVSDPYRDLAIAARSITWNMGGRWMRPFFEAYGAPLDERRIEFFVLLDEFVMARPDEAPLHMT